MTCTIFWTIYYSVGTIDIIFLLQLQNPQRNSIILLYLCQQHECDSPIEIEDGGGECSSDIHEDFAVDPPRVSIFRNKYLIVYFDP